MCAMYNMRLPASENAKLTRARTREPVRAASEDVVRARTAEQDVVTATAARGQRANHLSGFARA
jgi:hypothetical protein